MYDVAVETFLRRRLTVWKKIETLKIQQKLFLPFVSRYIFYKGRFEETLIFLQAVLGIIFQSFKLQELFQIEYHVSVIHGNVSACLTETHVRAVSVLDTINV